ncbi:MAG: DUF3553 domain-containing protein [Acidobacteriota bacterium]
MFKPGDLVRHRSKPEWGLGRITGQTGEGKVLVKFTSRTGDVLLTAEGAAAHLMTNTGSLGTPTSVVRHTAPVRRTPCVTCSTDVRETVTSPDGAWRSCVECSGRNSRQHVFLPYPASFDAAPAAASDGSDATAVDDPRAGWCNACRTGSRAFGYRNCSDVMR